MKKVITFVHSEMKEFAKSFKFRNPPKQKFVKRTFEMLE